MKVLFLGDIVGTPGMRIVRRLVPKLRQEENLDLVIANAENASAGSGLYPSNYRQLRDAGIDVLTMGDHIYKRLEILSLLEKNEPICKPANFPVVSPGLDWVPFVTADGVEGAVFSLMGRTYMRSVDCPFLAADRVLEKIPKSIRCIIVDVHAEATADKYLLGHYLKGRVSAIIGTHTHVTTADEQILEGGTGFLCDVGMTGPYHSILGRRIDRVLSAALNFIPMPFDVATEDVRLAGVYLEIDPLNGKCTSICRVMHKETGNPTSTPDQSYLQ